MVSNYIRGCKNLATTMVTMFVFSLLYITPGVVGRKNPLVELSKREDLLELMAGYGEEKLSTVLITGTVLCQDRSSNEAQRNTNYVAGAKVIVSCHPRRKRSKLSNWVQVTTDAHGDFVIDLPSHLHAIHNLEKNCFVKVVNLPNSSPCRRFCTGKQAPGLKLSSDKDGIRTYTAQSIYLIQKHLRGKKLRRTRKHLQGKKLRRTRKEENGALIKAY